MKEPDFLVVPGPVVSRTDGQRHYIAAHRLMELYGVHRSECVIATNAFLYKKYEGCYLLTPQYDGDYSLPDVLFDPCWEHQQTGLWIQHKLTEMLSCFTGAFA